MLALLGDNGAGKSTLVSCVSGVYPLDEGEILLDGEVVADAPAAARQAGIETVYQDLALFDNLTPAQNFFCGRELSWPSSLPRGLRILNARAMDRETAAVIDRLKVRAAEVRRAGGADVGWAAAGDRGGSRHRLRPQGRDPRRTNGGARACASRAR